MTNTRRTSVLLAGTIPLLMLVVVPSFWAFRQSKEAAGARLHTYEVLHRVDALMSALRTAESAQRGYLLTGDEAFLEPYFTVHDSFRGQLKELQQATLLGAARARLNAVAPLMDAKLANMSRNIEARRNNDMSGALADVSSGEGRQLMDSIGAGMGGFIELESSALARRNASFHSSMRNLFAIIVIASLVMLLYTTLFVHFLSREIKHRLKSAALLETQHFLELQENTNRQLEETNGTLHISEERFVATLNSIGDAVMATDNEGRVTLLNPVAEQLTGWTQAEAAGRPVEEIFHIINRITRQSSPVPVMEALKHGMIQGLAGNPVLISRAGHERTIADSCAPIRNRLGHIVGTVLVFRDITERMEIEAGLEKTRKELALMRIYEDAAREYSESLIDTVREPLIALDQDLRVVSVSRSFYEFFKVKPEETVGQLIYDLGNKQWDIPKLRELLENILPQKATFDNYEVEHDFAGIGNRTMLLNARQIKRVLGKERIILLAIEDITERKEIEAGLETTRKELAAIKIAADEASEFAESVINTVREPLISLDQDLRVVTVSRSFYEFFKVKPEETVGQLIYDLGNKQWDIPKLRELLENILPQKATFDNYEVEHDFAGIGNRTMLLNARQIKRVLGKERIILLAIEDITERKEVEDGLKKAHDELEALAVELKRAARTKSEFLANMSHELRTPLNSIIGFSEVLYDETFGPLGEKQKKYVTNVLTSGKHLLLLINQILDTAKVESGKMTLALSRLPMNGLLDEIALLVTDMVGKKKLRLALEIGEDLPTIEADELKVKEIIYNLLSNAVKFTPEGGVVGMRAKKSGLKIEIVVWDSGVGIAPENMDKIFEGFFRVDTPYSRLTEGTGLGLPLSRKLAELHGGKLTVESPGLGKGTSVRFTLPIVSGKAA